MQRGYLVPLKLGTIAGLLIGAIEGSKIIFAQRYVHFHLYNTAARIMASHIDRWALASIAVLYLLYLLFGFNSWYNLRNKKRALLLTTILISTFGVLHTYHSAQAADDISSGLAATDLVLPLIYCSACVIIGLLVMTKFRHIPDSVFAPAIAVFSAGTRIICALYIPCLVAVLAVNASAAVLHVKAAWSVRKQPNIIFIMVDTLRPDCLGCYGYHGDTSPNIDKLARDGIRFNRAVSQAPLTRWSVPSFMTSRYPQDIEGIGTGYVSDGQVTLAEVLKNYGYSTSAVVSNTDVGRSKNYVQGFDYFDDEAAYFDVSSPKVSMKASNQLDKLKDKRFFMFLLFIDPHSPYVLHSPLYGPQISITPGDKPTPGKLRDMHKYYDSEIRFTDEHIGMLMDKLKKQGLYDNSMIILLADHGEEFGDHGGLFHGRTLYREALSVPLIVKLPNQHQGRVIQGTARLLDVFPTIMRHLGMDNAALNLQGSPMELNRLRVLKDRSIFSAICVVPEPLGARRRRLQNKAPEKSEDLRSSTTDKYKYIVNTTRNKEMLFDRLQDPGEKVDISRKEPRVCSAMRRAIDERDASGKAQGTHGTERVKVPEITEQERARLRTLGYLAN